MLQTHAGCGQWKFGDISPEVEVQYIGNNKATEGNNGMSLLSLRFIVLFLFHCLKILFGL
jgi:hypothetical protein